jgi:hypothetical protein
LIAVASPASAQYSGDISGLSCNALWQARNQIYKDAGYCFKTARAIRFFGNGGCRYNNEAAVPLSAQDQRDIAMFQQVEREKRCPQ